MRSQEEIEKEDVRAWGGTTFRLTGLELSHLAVVAAAEIDEYLLKRGKGFENIKKLTDILRKSEGDLISENLSLNLALGRAINAMMKPKAIRDTSELALAVHQFLFELVRVPDDVDKDVLEKLRSFLVAFSRELLESNMASEIIIA